MSAKKLAWCINYVWDWEVRNDEIFARKARIIDAKIEKFPVIFSQVVEDFELSMCYSLQTLEGSPRRVGSWFEIEKCNSLKNLHGGPEHVRALRVMNCDNLESLDGLPKTVNGIFSISGCPKLPDWIQNLIKEASSWDEFYSAYTKISSSQSLVNAKNLGLF